jgi:hypothetical protein
MGQVTIYLDDETEQRARAAAQSQGVSLSKWVAKQVRQGAISEWPDFVRELAGAWSDLPSAPQLRRLPGKDTRRARL